MKRAHPQLGPNEEAPHEPTSEGFSDALTFAFAEPESGTCGVARIGLSPGASAASGLALLFSAGEVAGVDLAGGVATSAPTWEALEVGGLRTEIHEPLKRWRVSYDAGTQAGFDLEFAALGSAVVMDPGGAAARAGGMEGYEHMCRVTGTVRADGSTNEIHCLGQRGHAWGSPDWTRITLARSVSAWMGEDLAITLTAVRASEVHDHAGEVIEAAVLEGAPMRAGAVQEPRLSTVYDAEGRHRRAGLELWVGEESEFPRRAAGHVVCGTSVDLGRLSLRSAFFAWHMEDRTGIGRYDIVRRT